LIVIVRYVKAAIVAAALIAALVPMPPALVERWYSRGLYPPLQHAVTAAFSPVAVSPLDIAALLILLIAAVGFARSCRRHRFLVAVRRAALSLLVLSAVVYLWFLIFWGFNYRRLPLEQKLAYDAARLTRERAVSFGRIAVEQINALRSEAASAAAADEALAYALAEVESRLGATTHALPAEPKRSVLQWYFRKAAIDGMTDPWFLQIIVNPELLPFERPFVLAHEWAHLAGYADESEANFVAWLTCLSGPPAARYSGWLAAYEHVAAGLPRDDRRALRAALSPDVSADLNAATARFARSSPAVRTAARGAYDTYLRANRVEEGIASYNAVVRLMLGVSFDAAWKPELKR
jgi:hypothetical protein